MPQTEFVSRRAAFSAWLHEGWKSGRFVDRVNAASLAINVLGIAANLVSWVRTGSAINAAAAIALVSVAFLQLWGWIRAIHARHLAERARQSLEDERARIARTDALLDQMKRDADMQARIMQLDWRQAFGVQGNPYGFPFTDPDPQSLAAVPPSNPNPSRWLACSPADLVDPVPDPVSYIQRHERARAHTMACPVCAGERARPDCPLCLGRGTVPLEDEQP